MVICLEQSANDLRMVRLLPLSPHHLCFSKIQNGLSFWYRPTQVLLEKRPLNNCVCVCFPDHVAIPRHFQIFQVSGHPEYNFCTPADVAMKLPMLDHPRLGRSQDYHLVATCGICCRRSVWTQCNMSHYITAIYIQCRMLLFEDTF